MHNTERILYTDSYYTSISLAVQLLCVYGIYLVGTYTPKKGKPAASGSYPFKKMKGALTKLVKRGWVRRATQAFKQQPGPFRTSVVVQAIIWKDCKVCGFISTAFVGAMRAQATVARTVGSMLKGLTVAAHDVIIAYLRYCGGVDMADRGMADYDVGYRSTRWMMRVVFWCINAVFWNLWVIVLFKAHNGDGSLKQYRRDSTKRVHGRHLFNLDLSRAMIEHATTGALAEVGGDRRKVMWLPQDTKFGAGKAAVEQTPMASPTLPLLPQGPHYPPVQQPRPDNCTVCYAKHAGKGLSQPQRKKLCNHTQFRCVVCEKWICPSCWNHHHTFIGAPGAVIRDECAAPAPPKFGMVGDGGVGEK